jgi:hypothetical protein
VEGSDHRWIGSALDLKEKSVRMLLFRARKKLAAPLHQKAHGWREYEESGMRKPTTDHESGHLGPF